MSVFGLYAQYYDLLYANKDYHGEAAFVAGALRKQELAAGALLELGCGTGNHAAHLARTGYSVTGIDSSSTMLEQASQRRAAMPDPLQQRLAFAVGDARSYRCASEFDAVISLFHVFSYQTSNPDLAAAFETAAVHLRPGGVLLFDFWYGPAVLAIRPETRVRRLENERIRVLRIAESTLMENDNTVEVAFTVLVEDKATGEREELKERHLMRYLFLPEIDRYLEGVGMQRLAAGEWLNDATLSTRSWSGYVVAKKLGR